MLDGERFVGGPEAKGVTGIGRPAPVVRRKLLALKAADSSAFCMPPLSMEEEPFYRGLLLLALDRAFARRVRFLGVDWGWGAVLSCLLFGLAHAFGYAKGQFDIDALTMALTALPSLIAVWVRLRTGSVLLPVVMHNFGNSVVLLL